MNARIENTSTPTGWEGIAYTGISRRTFLVSSGAAAIAVTFGAGSFNEALAQAREFAPNAWMRVGADGIVTIFSPAAEMRALTVIATEWPDSATFDSSSVTLPARTGAPLVNDQISGSIGLTWTFTACAAARSGSASPAPTATMKRRRFMPAMLPAGRSLRIAQPLIP
jgi:hypothetical protein